MWLLAQYLKLKAKPKVCYKCSSSTVTQIRANCVKGRNPRSSGTCCSSEIRFWVTVCDPESGPARFSPEEETKCLCWVKKLCWAQRERFSIQQDPFTRVLNAYFLQVSHTGTHSSLWNCSWVNRALGSLWAKFVVLVIYSSKLWRLLMLYTSVKQPF